MPTAIPTIMLLRFVAPLGLILSLVSSLHAENSYIRVNQMGYELGLCARAYLMAPGPVGSAEFEILDSAGEVQSKGKVGVGLGTWGNLSVYAIDFRPAKEGKLSIRIRGAVSAVSPTFRAADRDDLYPTALANALSFYQNERDGPDFIPSRLRSAPGHLNDRQSTIYFTPKIDGNDVLIGDLKPAGGALDVSGGWWDAGDYLKFVQTHSYTVDLMLIGIRDFPAQLGDRARRSDFRDEARFGLDWLQKMWDDRTRTLYYQVGIGTGNADGTIVSDHDIWRLPQDDDTYGGSDPTYRYIRHRPTFVAGPAGSLISPNLAGRLTAAFAGGYQVFRQSDPAYAKQCLRSAEHIFELANTHPKGHLLTTAPFDFYPETEWRDDLELGATELYLALARGDTNDIDLPRRDPKYYLQAAAHWAHAYINGPNDAADTLNLYDVSGLAHFELCRALDLAGRDTSDLQISRADLVSDLKEQLDNSIAQAKKDPFGFGFPWAAYDTATHGAGLAVLAKEYSYLTHSREYDEQSQRWAGNILGANAWGASFIVGDGETFPHCMQHQVANIVGSLDGSEPRLDGALVEGPNSQGATGFVDGMRVCPANSVDVYAPFDGNGSVFIDNQESYATVEPAIDLTAGSLLMFAWRAAGAPADLR